MSKKQILLDFFDELAKLLKCKYSLLKAISLLENSTSSKSVKIKLAKDVKTKLEEGFDFYSCICLAGYEKEAEKYGCFLSSEKSEFHLEKILVYIVSTEKEKLDFRKNLISLCVYPIFVILSSMILTFYLIKNKEEFFAFQFFENKNEANILSGIYKAFGFLSFYSLGYFAAVYYMLRVNFGKCLIFNLYFLTQQKYSLKNAFQLMILSEKKTRNLFLLQSIQNQLGEGRDFFSIGMSLKIFSKKQKAFIEKTQWIKDMSQVFADYFQIEKKAEKERIGKIQKYSEGIFIFGVGIYLLILIKNSILTFLNY